MRHNYSEMVLYASQSVAVNGRNLSSVQHSIQPIRFLSYNLLPSRYSSNYSVNDGIIFFMKTINVTVYSDYVCPYCYIGAARVQQLQQEYDPPIVWKSFELHPDAPAGGIPSSMFYQNNPNLKRISENAQQLAAAADLQLGDHVIYSNSRLALELGEFAEQAGKGRSVSNGNIRLLLPANTGYGG